MKKYSIMKTEARYAIDGKTHYSVMKEIAVEWGEKIDNKKWIAI